MDDEDPLREVTRAIEGNVVRYKWQDAVNLAHAGWILGAPWWMRFEQLPSWDHWAVGAAVGAAVLVSLPRARIWKEAIIVAAGGWLFFSPWLLGFSTDLNAR